MRAGFRQGGEGENGGAFEIAGEEEPAGGAIGKPRLAGGVEVIGIGLGQRFRPGFVVPVVRVAAVQRRSVRCGDGPAFEAVQHLRRPGAVVLFEKRKVEEPFPGVVDDVEMERAGARQPRQEPRGRDAERQAQLAHPPGAFGPVGRGAGQGVEMRLVVEAGHRIVGLGLEIGGADAAFGGGDKPLHPGPAHEVCHKRGDEDGLPCAAEPGDAKPQNRFEERFGHGGNRALDPPRHAVRNIADDHASCPSHFRGPR